MEKMRKWNRAFAFILIAIAGMTGGTLLIISWRVLALAIVSFLCVFLGINYWRASYKDVKIEKKKGFFKSKLHHSVFVPVIAIALGAAIAGVILGAID